MRSAFLLGLLLSVLLASFAFSEDTSGKFGVSLVGGWYMPDLEELHDDFMYGGSFSYHFLPWLFGEIKVSMFYDRIQEFTETEYRKSYYTRIIDGVKYPAGQSSSEVSTNHKNVRTAYAGIWARL